MTLPIACIDPIEILFALGMMFIGGPLLFVVSLIPYRKATRLLARSQSNSAAFLFGATAVLTLLWAGLLALVFGFFALQLERGNTVVLYLGAFGSLMLLNVLISNQNSSDKTKADFPASARDVMPERLPFQIWAQDLFIALICYGAGLLILSIAFGLDRGRMTEFLYWAAYIMLAGTAGLLFAVDFCRRQVWSQTAWKRAGVFVAVFTIFPMLLPLALLAWWRWRRALELQAKMAHAAH